MYLMRPFTILLTCLLASPLPALASSHPCARVADPSARLECYDAAFPPDPGAVMSAPDAARSDFGLEKPVEPGRVESRVSSVDYARGARSVTLENGHVWVQTDAKVNAQVRPGDTVSVRRGMVGNYIMTTANGVAVRVRRVR